MLGYQPNNKTIYKKALTHKSADKYTNNERLEFLGDAILSLVVSELLFLENTDQEEGFLSKKRATIVARKHLNIVGKKIIPSNKIKHKLNPVTENIFGNTLEAIIGAIYIDRGFLKAKKFISTHVYSSGFIQKLLEADFKTELLKYGHKKGVKIEYVLQKKTGLDHKKEFLVAVFIENKKIAEATGDSIKEAEQNAAKKTINNVF